MAHRGGKDMAEAVASANAKYDSITKKNAEDIDNTFKQIKDLQLYVEGLKAATLYDGRYYNVLDMLSAPFSKTYKDILRRSHSEEWIENFEEMIKERNR